MKEIFIEGNDDGRKQLKRKVRMYKSQAERLRKELEGLLEDKREIEEYKTRIANLEERNIELSRKLREKSYTIKELKAYSQELENKYESLEDDLEKVPHSQRIEQLKSELSSTKKMLEKAEDKVEKTEKEKEDLDTLLRSYEKLGTPKEIKEKLSSDKSPNGSSGKKSRNITEKKRSKRKFLTKGTIKRDILKEIDLNSDIEMTLDYITEVVYVQKGREDNFEKAKRKTYVQINNLRNENGVKIKVDRKTGKIVMGEDVEIKTGVGKGNYKRD